MGQFNGGGGAATDVGGRLALAPLGRGEIGTGQDAGAGSTREFIECRGQCGLGYDECDHLAKTVPRTSRNGLRRHKSMVTPPTAKPARHSHPSPEAKPAPIIWNQTRKDRKARRDG